MELENVEDIYPLTSTQAGMLFHTTSAPHSGVYIVQMRCLLSGDLDVQTFQSAWRTVLQRHPALRTAFLWNGLDEPLQVVRQRVDLDWEVLDWSDRAAQEQTSKLEGKLVAQRRAGFDLSDAPLMRMLLVHVDGAKHHFVWTCHHLLVDGWSAAIVLDEVFRLYQAGVGNRDCLLPPAAPFRDYIAWLRSLKLEAAAEFWRGYLQGFVSRTSLRTPPVAEHAAQKPLHQVVEARISPASSAALLRSIRQLRVTLSTLLHGIWSIVLQRYSDDSDVVFGTTVAGRPANLPGIEQSVGLFINTLPVRVRVDENQVLGDWLASLQENLLQIRQYEHTPLVRIQEWSDMPRGKALFDTLLVLVNYPKDDASGDTSPKLKIVEREILDQSNYPLAFLMVPEEELRLIVVYDPSAYSDETVKGILDNIQTLVSATPVHLNQPICELPMLSDEMNHKLLVAWNDTAEELPRDVSVLNLISEHVERAPAATALTCADGRLSYRELGVVSDRLARNLIGIGVQPGDRVAICLERSVELITGILAILKAGGIYVPLDPNYPDTRLEYMLRDSGAALVLTSQKLAAGLSACAVKPLLVDGGPLPPGNDSEHLALPTIEAEQPAYLIYTSGSTGNPKGVLISHRNLLSSTLARHRYYQNRPSVFLLLSSVAFDSSVAGIFWTLTSGAELLVSAHLLEQDIGQLASYIEKQGVTHTLCLPSLYELLLEHAEADLLKALHTVVVAGEAVSERLVQLHRTRLPGVTLYNEYGPTEATVWCTVYDTNAHQSGTAVSIGRPIANARIFILDSRQRPLPPGVPGELYVGGDGVALGYWNRAEVTAQKFLIVKLGDVEQRLYRTGDLARYLPEGNIEFLGRVDRQLKLRGYRIEPAEIESVLLQHPDIQEAVVLLAGGATAEAAEAESEDESPQRLADHLQALGSSLAERMLAEIEVISDEEASRTIAADNALSKGY